MFDTILRDLQQPEYVHTLLNPLPIYGLAIACFGLGTALYLRSRGGERTALILIFATALSAWPVVHYGNAAFDRVLSMSDQVGEAWLKAHAHRVDLVVWSYYLVAFVALLALFLPAKWPEVRLPLLLLTLLLALGSLGCGSYIAHAGGKIRHREFRNVPPPAVDRSGER